jgi:RNA polymerase sigma-70 factor (family 1)
LNYNNKILKNKFTYLYELRIYHHNYEVYLYFYKNKISFLNEKTLNITKGIDKASFEAMFREYHRSLCMYAQNFIKDSEAIEDIVHEVFVNLWEKRDEIDEAKSIKSYLFRSIHNRCLNYIRDNKKFANSGDFEEQTENISSKEEGHAIETAELQVHIQEALNSLPEKCREVFLLSRFEELKYSEIADKLHISIKTVENHISKALKIMREKLGDYLPILLIAFLFIKHVGGNLF